MLVESLLNKEMQGYTLNEEIYYVKWKVMKFLVCSKIFDQKSLKREREREIYFFFTHRLCTFPTEKSLSLLWKRPCLCSTLFATSELCLQSPIQCCLYTCIFSPVWTLVLAFTLARDDSIRFQPRIHWKHFLCFCK